MIITGIERQKKRPERVNIFIDGEFACGIHESVLLRFGLRKGDPIDAETVKSLENNDEFNLAKDKALRLISYRLRSEQEIRKRLTEKEYTPAVIQQVITNLLDADILNDRKFALAFIHDTILKKKAGKSLLKRELRQKGVAPELVDEVLNESVQTDEEETRALEAAANVLGRYQTSRKKTDVLKQRQRITSYLARRGYDFSTISKVTKKLFAGSTATRSTREPADDLDHESGEDA